MSTKLQDDDSYQLDVAAEQLVSAARLSQQLAMNDTSRNFTLVIQSNQVDILADGASMAGALESIPINLSAGISYSPSVNLTFDGLGETVPTTITVTSNSTVSVCFESSGFIHRC